MLNDLPLVSNVTRTIHVSSVCLVLRETGNDGTILEVFLIVLDVLAT